jgi:N-acetyl sugar amidotransferase
MDTTDTDIVFNDAGVCNHCLRYDVMAKPIVDRADAGQALGDLERVVDRMKRQGRGKDYDCIIGLSGGVDSTYVALKVKELGLRPLAVHFDSGWNSELAVKNIENIVKKLDIDLDTFVVDWEEMRDLQLAFLRSSVANCDTPTDHAFLAVLYRSASGHGIRSVVTGTNFATEFILPRSWGYSPADLVHLRAIHKRFGSRPLRQYPTLGFFSRYLYYPVFRGIRTVRILNYLPYNKAAVKAEIAEKLDWRDYGGKHHESIFTRFFQTCYLPKKFGYDKRRAHLASLIVSGQITRDDALHELSQDNVSDSIRRQDAAFVAKKLGIKQDEMDAILLSPGVSYKAYPTEEALYNAKDRVWSAIKKARGITTARV